MPPNKKNLTETDICMQFITPAIVRAGWDKKGQIRREEFFTDGKIIVRGKIYSRGKRKRADYVLYYKPNQRIAVIEAKDNKHSLGSGMQQALEYARLLDVPFVYSSNGDGFLEHDMTAEDGEIEKELNLEQFPSPEELWARYIRYKGLETPEQERVTKQEYFFDSTGKKPRYYQHVAINRCVEAIVKGQNRLLLVMATGTGKTYTAFQIIYRLWKADVKKRILFLADRNALLTQTKKNDFRHFGDVMTIIRHKKIDKSFQVYLALYQGLTNYDEDADAYREFSPDFFDLIVIDECHRGSAAEASAWREILDYFKTATHVGLTATPKETKDISNIEYFGDPVYTYSLKQGIDDGFLAPYKVIKIGIDKDLDGWRPEDGKRDRDGDLVDDRIYNRKDFDRSLVIDERTKLVAEKISEYLSSTNRFDKTIVFCTDIDHAERMRQALVNWNSGLALENPKYVMRITGDELEGKRELDNFVDVEETYPVIATTSKLLTTGIDAKTCKLLVLDSNIQSMTEFKQIIGRGTRLEEDYGKFYFTIMDFRNATDLFADPDFDGEPVQIYEPGPDDIVTPPDDYDPTPDPDEDEILIDPFTDTYDDDPDGEKKRKVYVNGVPVSVSIERVQYLGLDGKLITENLKDYSRKNIKEEFQSLDDFLNRWNKTEKKETLIAELEDHGIMLSELKEDVGKDMDVFDIICHIAFDMPPMSRKERAENVIKRNYFTKYEEKAKMILVSLLEKYADEGITTMESMKVLKLNPMNVFGTPSEILEEFGGKDAYLSAIKELEKELYKITG